MTEDALTKLQEAQQKGKPVELNPGEIIGFSSDFFQSLMPSSDIAAAKIIVRPAQDVMHRRFRFRLTFALREEREELPYVEFEMVQPGQEELVIRSSAPPMPLKLTLSLSLVGGPSNFRAEYSYVGHEIRKIHKAHKALQLLQCGGTLEIVDLESDRLLCVMGGAQVSAPSDEEQYLDKFITALHEVALAFNEKITWAPDRTRDDSIHIQLLQEVAKTGRVSLPVDSITITLEPSPGVDIEQVLRQHQTLRIDQSEPPFFATLFGKAIDVGPYHVIVQPSGFEIALVEGQPDSRSVRIALAQQLIYEFERFRRDPPNTN